MSSPGVASSTSAPAMMDRDGLRQLADFDAIYPRRGRLSRRARSCVAVGLLLPIRQGFDQYVNLRPIQVAARLAGPLRDKGPAEIDILFIRENTEGEYSGLAGGSTSGSARGSGDPDLDVHPARRRAHRALRVRSARERRKSLAAPPSERAPLHDGLLGRGRRRGRRGLPRCRGDHVPRGCAGGAHGHGAGDAGRGRRPATSSATSSRTWAARFQGSWACPPVGEPQPGAALPLDVRAGPRLGAAEMPGRGRANPMATVWAGALMLAEQLGETEAARPGDGRARAAWSRGGPL